MLKYTVEEINQSYNNLYPQSDKRDMIYIIQNNKEINMCSRKFVESYKVYKEKKSNNSNYLKYTNY